MKLKVALVEALHRWRSVQSVGLSGAKTPPADPDSVPARPTRTRSGVSGAGSRQSRRRRNVTAVSVMPAITASPMSSRCSVSRVEMVPRTRPGIAANASARQAAARRTTKAARTASDPPAFSSPSATAGSAAVGWLGRRRGGVRPRVDRRSVRQLHGLGRLGLLRGLRRLLGHPRRLRIRRRGEAPAQQSAKVRPAAGQAR